MASVDLGETFDQVLRDLNSRAEHKLGIEQWLVRFVYFIYKDVTSRERHGDSYSEEFNVGVGVYQCSTRFSSSLYKRPCSGTSVQPVHGS